MKIQLFLETRRRLDLIEWLEEDRKLEEFTKKEQYYMNLINEEKEILDLELILKTPDYNTLLKQVNKERLEVVN